MADRDKVIKGLTACRKTICESCPYNASGEENVNPICFINEMISDALALLKEQEAVKPIPFFTETGAESPNYVVCGHCKSIKAIMPKYTKQKYCHECGFPVLWECR